MANRRMIASDIWRDDFVCTLDYFERLLWIGMVVTCADDQGRIQDRAGFIASDVFPGEVIALDTINDALAEFEAEGKIVRYSADKVKLIQIVNWWGYQTPSWAAASKYPAPKGWVDRVKIHTKENKTYQLNWELTGGFGNSQPPVPTASQPPVPTGIEEGDVKRKLREEERKVENHSPAPISINQTGDSFTTTVFSTVTGMTAIPGGDLPKVLPAIDALRAKYPTVDKLTAYLTPYYQYWQTKKTKDGRPFSKSNCAWLYDWAVAGDPLPTDKKPPNAKPDPDCPVCGGMGLYRKDLDVHDPNFGKLTKCECVKVREEVDA